MDIVTGYRAEPHITSQQDRDTNRGIIGSGSFVLNVGSKFEPTIISANQVDIADGVLSLQGCIGLIEYGNTDSLAISNGSLGMLRKDLIVARYTKDVGTQVESMDLVVIEGTPAASSPNTPAYTQGTIAEGDTTVDFPLFVVNINGISIDSVERLASTSTTLNDMASELTSLINGKAPLYAFTSNTDLNNAINGMATGTVFVLKGTGAFSQDVFGTDNPVNCFGLAMKTSSTTCIILGVANGKLHYVPYNKNGSFTAYTPVNLATYY